MSSSPTECAPTFDAVIASKITVFVDVQGYTFDGDFFVREAAIKRRNGSIHGFNLKRKFSEHQQSMSVKRQLAKINLKDGRLEAGYPVEEVVDLIRKFLTEKDVVCVDNDFLFAFMESLGINVVHMDYGEEEWRLRRLYWTGLLTTRCERHQQKEQFNKLNVCAFFVVQAMEIIVNAGI